MEQRYSGARIKKLTTKGGNGDDIKKCAGIILQSSGTCYFNSILNGIFISRKLRKMAFDSMKIYMDQIDKNPIIIDKDHRIDIELFRNPNLKLTIEKSKAIINKPNTNVDDTVITIKNVTVETTLSRNPAQLIRNPTLKVRYNTRDLITEFLIMKTIYFYMCESLRTSSPTTIIKHPKCSLDLPDYLRILASFIITINSDTSFLKKIINKIIKPTITLYTRNGGFQLQAFRNMLSFINNKIEYIDLNKPNYISSKNFTGPADIIIFYGSDMSSSMIHHPMVIEEIISKKKIQQIIMPIEKKIYEGSVFFEVKKEILKTSVTYELDHVNITIYNGERGDKASGHAIIGILCNDTPFLIDSNNPLPTSFAWNTITTSNKNNLYGKEFYYKFLYMYPDLVYSSFNYLCYVRKYLPEITAKDYNEIGSCAVRDEQLQYEKILENIQENKEEIFEKLKTIDLTDINNLDTISNVFTNAIEQNAVDIITYIIETLNNKLENLRKQEVRPDQYASDKITKIIEHLLHDIIIPKLEQHDLVMMNIITRENFEILEKNQTFYYARVNGEIMRIINTYYTTKLQELAKNIPQNKKEIINILEITSPIEFTYYDNDIYLDVYLYILQQAIETKIPDIIKFYITYVNKNASTKNNVIRNKIISYLIAIAIHSQNNVVIEIILDNLNTISTYYKKCIIEVLIYGIKTSNIDIIQKLIPNISPHSLISEYEKNEIRKHESLYDNKSLYDTLKKYVGEGQLDSYIYESKVIMELLFEKDIQFINQFIDSVLKYNKDDYSAFTTYIIEALIRLTEVGIENPRKIEFAQFSINYIPILTIEYKFLDSSNYKVLYKKIQPLMSLLKNISYFLDTDNRLYDFIRTIKNIITTIKPEKDSSDKKWEEGVDWVVNQLDAMIDNYEQNIKKTQDNIIGPEGIDISIGGTNRIKTKHTSKQSKKNNPTLYYYNKKYYKIHHGKKGGKYILIGAEKIKKYI